MDKTIIVLPSARAIRYKQLSFQENLFLPTYVTMGDFISKLCIVKGYKYIDDDTRTIILLEASNFKSFSNLQIERNFFTFTRNSSYIFKFFEELSAEMYDISNLSSADIYAEYEEHIEILTELYRRYKKLCDEKKLLDKIFLPELYKFNSSYLKKDTTIEIYLDGYLTNFEFKLLEEATKYTNINLIFTASRFNTKMQNKLKEFGLELKVGYRYRLNFNKKEILDLDSYDLNKNLVCESFSENILQISFIKKKIYDFISKGYEAEKIAVIVPNESIANYIKSFDKNNNLNLAMGISYKETYLYQKIKATLNFIEQDSKENNARLSRFNDDIYSLLYKNIYKNSDEINFIEILKEIKDFFDDKKELEIFEQEIYHFEKIMPILGHMSIKSLFTLFMQRLLSKTIDDVAGGKITVMGVLETRSIDFNAIVIIDFDENSVPKKSDKDMFLNTQIREFASLPTMKDREDLQKHYYEMLINSSKEVAISYVKDAIPSRFLKSLGIKEKKNYDEDSYANILFKNNEKKENYIEQEIVLPYSFKDIDLSATKLKIFLSCKRKYYYKYIKSIKFHEIPKDIPKEYEIGSSVHLALKNLYMQKDSYFSVDELKKDLSKELDNVRGKTELDKYLISMQKKLLEPFCENEIKRFMNGWKVYRCEKYYKQKYNGINIIGQIDRVDKKDNFLEVLDYKTGSYTLATKKSFPQSVDFQLEFYKLLAKEDGEVASCAFYDLKNSKIIPESFLDEKLAILDSHIKTLLDIEEINFEKCEDIKNCNFCEYKVMCKR